MKTLLLIATLAFLSGCVDPHLIGHHPHPGPMAPIPGGDVQPTYH